MEIVASRQEGQSSSNSRAVHLCLLDTQPAEGPQEPALLAVSDAMRTLVATADRLARVTIPVLVQGETGVGKEMLARRLHARGPRRARPLIVVNCAAIPQQLVESTLFGHERGAFTGAMETKKGIFEAASGGTVLLDEIGELGPAAQAALLRVLETKRVMRVGGTAEIAVDVRVVAATHRDLEAMCHVGTFRWDLLYRLNAIALVVPPLRERRGEISALACSFLRDAAGAHGETARSLDAEALAALERHDWPGNVRELRNAMERAAVLATGSAIGVADLPEALRARRPALVERVGSPARTGGSTAGSLRDRLQRLEAEVIVDALRAAGFSQRDAARRLGVPLRTLQHKLKVHGIRRLGYGQGDTRGRG